MTVKAKATQADIKRAICAARASGLRVLAVRPDGTVITGEPSDPHPLVPVAEPGDDAQGWEGILADD